MSKTKTRTRRRSHDGGARGASTTFTMFDRTTATHGGVPPRRGNRIAVIDEPYGYWRITRAILIGVVFVALVIDQAYRPDLSRQREVLMTQIAEATERMDRTRQEMDFIASERDGIARNGVPEKAQSRWTGEPYRSTEHCLFDYDRRLGHLRECLLQVLAQAQGFGADLQAIDAGGGRRVPLANQLAAWLRRELHR